jgi:hypothetical protein
MRLPQKISPIILTLKSISILSINSKTKTYGKHTKRTLITLQCRYLRTPTGLKLGDLNNYFDVIEYRFLIRKVSYYYKYYTTSLTRITL